MAQKVQVVLTCDLDEEEVPAAETVTFGYDGSNYAFELCENHLAEFAKTMQGYVAVARPADGGPRRRRTSAPASAPRSRPAVDSTSSAGNIREWARENGYEVSDRGRIPAEVRAAFEAAN
ncbi:MAG TPA: Lsr2 family protein [Acidimicrobiales bacterium]|nr:Lsr2 family protein [Acidimicrobiales bacterium]